MIPEFKPGATQLSAEHLNEIVIALNKLTGGEFITVRKMPGGAGQIDLNLARLLPRIPHARIPTFILKITDELSGAFAWTEQRTKDDGTLEDKPAAEGGRSGTTTVNPAREMNGQKGLYKSNVVSYFEAYEFISSGGTKYYRFNAVREVVFIASITNELSGAFAWTEQRIKDDGTLEAKPVNIGGRSGTTTVNPAKEINGRTGLYAEAKSSPFFVLMFEFVSENGTKFYRFNMVFPPVSYRYNNATYNDTDGKPKSDYIRFSTNA